MERINLVKGKGKRRLEGGDDEEEGRLRINSRPALAGVIIEAQKVDCSHCSCWEPTIRKVFREEIQGALAELSRTLLIGRSSSQRIKGPDGRNLQLHFKSRLSLPLFTGGKVEGEQGAAICVELIDANTGHVVTSGPESSIALDVLVLKGDFNNEDDAGWSQEEFDSHVVKEREGKRPLLIGDLQVTLKKGVGTLGHLSFTDNSSWIRSKKFRLGLKVSLGYCEGVRIREAKSEAFTVKDHRGELYKKHYPPTLIDEVWRLEKIMKDGPFHKRLNNAGICNVEGFLRLVVRDSQELRNILGSGMSNKMWNAVIEHARTCVLSEKLYVYYPDDSRIVGVVFNNIYELRGLVDNDQYFPEDSLSDSQKVDVDTWAKKAYANWNQIVEYEGKPLLNFKQTSDLPLVPVNDHPHTSDNQLPSWGSPVSVPFGPSSVDQSMLVGGSGYNDSMTQLLNSNTCSQFEPASFTQPANLNTQLLNSNTCSQFEPASFTQQANLTTQLLNSNTCSQFEPASFTQQANLTNQITGTSYGNGVGFALSPSFEFALSPSFEFALSPSFEFALSPSLLSEDFAFAAGPSHSLPFDSSIQQASVNPFYHNNQNEINSFISGDVNHQMLGNEDMQHSLANDISTDNASLAVPEVEMILNTDTHHFLLNEFSIGDASLTVPEETHTKKNMQNLVPNFGMGGHVSVNVPEDDFNFDSGRDRSRSDEAVVGWLKIKAAMRWGIFIRKKAAERRAQLVELDDDE